MDDVASDVMESYLLVPGGLCFWKEQALHLLIAPAVQRIVQLKTLFAVREKIHSTD